MQLQFIPSSSSEIITNTLAGAKSIRGFFFVLKDEAWLKQINYQPTVSLSVEGVDLCKDLMIMPFCVNPIMFDDDITHKLGLRTQDYRKVDIKSCMDVAESVIRIAPIADNVLDIVLELADEPVENNEIQWIESLMIDSSKLDANNYMNAFLREKPEGVFAYDKFTAAGRAVAYGEGLGRRIEINGNKEICPLMLHDIAPTTRRTWQDVSFRIYHPCMDKNIRLTVGAMSDDPIFLYFSKQIILRDE